MVKSILIKDTTREEREQIVAEALESIEGACEGCAPGMERMFEPYIEGIKELREVNREFNARYVSGAEGPDQSRDCGFGY